MKDSAVDLVKAHLNSAMEWLNFYSESRSSKAYFAGMKELKRATAIMDDANRSDSGLPSTPPPPPPPCGSPKKRDTRVLLCRKKFVDAPGVMIPSMDKYIFDTEEVIMYTPEDKEFYTLRGVKPPENLR